MTAQTFICAENGIRLDKFLAETLPDVSRNQAQQLIAAERVTVNGKPSKPSAKLSSGMEISVVQAETSGETSLAARNIPLNILYEDDTILVLNKPAGLVVHPAAGHAEDTLVNALIFHYPDMAALDSLRPGIVHRLDRDTSGVMVVGKTAAAVESLQRQFKARTVEKYYLALVRGTPQSSEGVIDVPLGRHPTLRQKFTPLPNGKPARTHYWVEETLAGYSLLRVKLDTGRTHQIRVHLTWLGHPIVGDTVYGHKKNRLKLSRQFLHAHTLSFEHPTQGKQCSFSAPLPPELENLLQQLR